MRGGCSCFPKNAHSFTRIMTQKGLRSSFPGPLFYVQKFIANPHTPSHPFPHKGNPATQHFQPNNPLNQPKQPQFSSNSPHNFLPIPPSELGLNRALLECSSGNNPHGNPAESPGFSALLCPYFTMSLLEPVFTAEDAGWAKNFPARQGAFSRECLVHFKKTQRGMAEKDPPRRRLRL